ncbi:hypothetical protein [Lysinibacillus fusiformis]|nr:hypothetical protein [Lysinibacillus fusiformis]
MSKKCQLKGADVKKLHPLDNDLQIVNEAIVNFFLKETDQKKL